MLGGRPDGGIWYQTLGRPMLRQFSIIRRVIDADRVMSPGSRRAAVSGTRWPAALRPAPVQGSQAVTPVHAQAVTPVHVMTPGHEPLARRGRRRGWLRATVLAVSVIGSSVVGPGIGGLGVGGLGVGGLGVGRLGAQEWDRSGQLTRPRPDDSGDGRVRMKRPDRDVYRPPTLSPNAPSNPLRESPAEGRPTRPDGTADRPHLSGESAGFEPVGYEPAPFESAPFESAGFESAELGADPRAVSGEVLGGGAEVHRPVAKAPLTVDPIAFADVRPEGEMGQPGLRPVSHDEPRLAPWADGPGLAAPLAFHDAGTGFGGFACDGMGCDGMGCDAYGCAGIGSRHRRLFNARISCDPCQWFGSVEVLLMFRKGDVLPPLVTTGPAGDADTAGELGQAGTSVLLGGERLLRDMTVGGRFMVGTWLDPRRDRSLTLRGWFAGEESHNFRYADPASGVLARPFLDVSGGQTPEANTQLVAFPDRASGSLRARLDSEIYGADVAVRQFLAGDLGGTVDVLYGYQYLRLNEGLGIRSTSMSLDDDFAPVGSVLGLSDRFEAKNEFHGGQIGIASHYREGCWSFDGLLKVGFGQLRREAFRRGETVTSIDTATAIADEGLLVRESNRGRMRDHTFGWVPELDLSLGWQRFPHLDVTVGYHLVVVTDALQVSGMIDRDLAVDLDNPPAVGRPAGNLRYQTFYVQGIHFGLQYAY